VDSTVAALGHDWGDWLTRTAATCTEKGLEYRTCSRCSVEETRETEALDHDYQAVVVNPTYFEDGYTLHTCSRCGDNYRNAPGSKLTLDLPPPRENADAKRGVHVVFKH
jgi:hypothetical protein